MNGNLDPDALALEFQEAFRNLEDATKILFNATDAVLKAKDEFSREEAKLYLAKDAEGKDLVNGSNAEKRKAQVANFLEKQSVALAAAEADERIGKAAFAQAKNRIEELEIYLRILELKK